MKQKPKSLMAFSSVLSQSSYLPRIFRLVWKAAKAWTLIWFILLFIQGLLPAATVYLTKLLVDSLATAMKMGISQSSVESILVAAVPMAVVLLLTELIKGALGWVRTVQAELVQDHISAMLHTKSIGLDMSFYETPEYYDRLERARSDASGRSLALLENGGSLLQNGITLLAIATILIPYGAWLPLALLFSALPAVYVLLRFNRRYHQWWQQTTQDRRWTQYYDMLLTHSAIAAEIRLFDLGDYFQSSYQSLRRKLRTERIALLKQQSLARLGAGSTALVISGIAIVWMVWQALQGRLTLGDLALFYQAFNRGQSLTRSLLESAGQIYTNSLFLSNLFEFLSLKPQVVDPPQPEAAPLILNEGIRFQQVAFRYPGSQRLALQNFNLNIPAGKIVAIVGPNGAGKSTLIKLLCRFYDPEAGCIKLDGTDIRNLPVKDLRRLITVLFQFPVPYHATAAQNIALGDLSLQPDQSEIEAAARNAGAHEIISRMPQGYDTLLGKWFVNGTELSGGEWQRVALSRAFLRQAQLIILDEPTSFMDSWAEADWLDRFRTLGSNRTAVIITHRFTLAMRADIIHVMHSGRIVESGRHDELLSQGGLYAQSWAAQMQASTSVPV